MKTLPLLLAISLLCTSLLAQDASKLQAQNTGYIIFEEKMNIHKRMTGDRAQYKSMVPEFRTEDMILAFNESEALYAKKNDVTGEEEVISDENRRMVMFKAMAPNNQFYTDFKKNKLIESREFMSREFLIDEDREAPKWKITPYQTEILGYICQEATLTNEDSTITKAWFTTQIPIPVGPKDYASLPGMILKVDINDADLVIEATKVELGEVNPDWIKVPKKGKKVSKAEFKSLVKEKMEEMKEMYGGRGNVHVITR